MWTFEFFEDTPFFSTGHSLFDGIVSIAWVLILCTASISLIQHFVKAYEERQHVSQETPERRIRLRPLAAPTVIWMFIGLAGIAFVVVTSLKFEHRTPRIASWDAVQSLTRAEKPKTAKEQLIQFSNDNLKAPTFDLSNMSVSVSMPTVDQVTEGANHAAGKATDVVKGAANVVKSAASVVKHGHVKENVEGATEEGLRRLGHGVKRASSHAEELASHGTEVAKDATAQATEGAKGFVGHAIEKTKDTASDVVETVVAWGDRSSKFFLDKTPIPNSLARSFSWGVSGPRDRMSMWESFQTLVNEHRNFWWTQQWMSAYVAWAVFVGIESVNRTIPAVEFVLLGYAFSLGMAQSLYFALMLLQPSIRKSPRRMYLPCPETLANSMLFPMLVLPFLPLAYRKLGSNQSTFWISAPVFFNLLQGVLAAWPVVIAWAIRHYRVRLFFSHPRYRPYFLGRQLSNLTLVWYGASVIILVMHVVSTVRTFQEAWSMRSRWWWMLGLHRLPLNGGADSETAQVSGFTSILGVLGVSHPWIGALSWDVIFSVASISLWIAVSYVDLDKILKYSFWPWLDDTVDAVKEGVEKVKQVTEPYVEAGQELLEQLQDAAEPYAQKAKQTAKTATKAAQPYLETAQEYAEDGIERAGIYAKDAAKPYAKDLRRRAKKARKSIEPYLDGTQEYVEEGASRMKRYANDGVDAARKYSWQYDEEEAEEEDEEEALEQPSDEEVDDSEWTEARRGRRTSPRKRGPPAKNERTASASRSPAPGRASSRSSARKPQAQASPAKKRRGSRIKDLAAAKMESKDVRRKVRATERTAAAWSRKLPLKAELPEGLASRAQVVALTWGFWIFGGLGFASTSVFGAEEICDE